MSTELEDRLTESMHSYAASVSTAGVTRLAARAAARHRHRQLAIGGTATAFAAAGTAGVLLVTLAAARPAPPGVLGAQTAAYVTTRTEQALAGRAQADFVFVRTTVGGPGVPAAPWAPRTRVTTTENWSYGRQNRMEVYAAHGKPVADTGLQATSKTTTVTTVLYRSATWWRSTYRTLAVQRLKVLEPRCGPFLMLGMPFLDETGPAPDWAGLIRHALACGQMVEAGNQVIDGQHVIRLDQTASSEIGGWRSVYWVSSSTYLPVRIRMDATSRPRWWDQEDFTWAQPTRANLALLRVPIPPGFRRVTSPDIGPEAVLAP
jgi:hypothetical protein